MQQLKKDPFSFRIFPLFVQSSELIHGTFLAPHDCSDRNIKEIAQQIIKERELDGFVYCNQIHKDTIHIVTDKSENKIICVPDTDALITKQKNIALCIRHADCQAALFYDKYNRVIAIVHAGWKGLVQNVYSKVVNTMRKKFSSNPSDIIVCISPSLGPTVSEYMHHAEVFPKYFYAFQIAPNYFDFWKLATYQLTQVGIRKDNMQVSGICSFSSPDHFFSYRRTKTQKRNASLIALKS